MTLTITIDMDYAAFDDRPGEEVARILRVLEFSWKDRTDPTSLRVENILDYNGNAVGKAEVTP